MVTTAFLGALYIPIRTPRKTVDLKYIILNTLHTQVRPTDEKIMQNILADDIPTSRQFWVWATLPTAVLSFGCLWQNWDRYCQHFPVQAGHLAIACRLRRLFLQF